MLLRRMNTVASVGVLVGLCVSAVTAEIHWESAPHRCVGCATGNCPAGSPHGYWKPTWRRWPGASTYRGFRRPTPEIDVPVNQVPDALDEIRINSRSRSEEPLEGDATLPQLPEMTGDTPSDAGGTPFAPSPEAGPPTVDPNLLFPDEPFDPTPAPPDNLFDDLTPPATAPEATPDDNLFDDFGLDVPQSPGTPRRISQRAIRSRSLATLDAGPPTELERTPPRANFAAVSGSGWNAPPLATPAKEDTASWNPTDTGTPAAEQQTMPRPNVVPPNQVTQASHLEAIDPHEPDQAAADLSPVASGTTHTNPLRPHSPPAAASAVPTKAAAEASPESPKRKALQVSAQGSVQTSAAGHPRPHKRVLRNARQNESVEAPLEMKQE